MKVGKGYHAPQSNRWELIWAGAAATLPHEHSYTRIKMGALTVQTDDEKQEVWYALNPAVNYQPSTHTRIKTVHFRLTMKSKMPMY